jgi:hypothetical protein
MTELLASLRQDLLGRRMLPLLVLVGVALLGAVAYTALGGGGSSHSANPSASASPLPSVPPTLATPAPANPHQASAETTSGSTYQSAGTTRDPFIPLPRPKEAKGVSGAAATGSSAATTGSSSSTTGSGGKSTGGGSAGSGASGTGGNPSAGAPGGSSGNGGSGGAKSGEPSPSKPAPKPKAKPQYRVALQFGVAPPAGQNPQLTPYADLSKVTPLPSKENQLIAFAGVSASGKDALFTLIQPAILKGNGVCQPSAAQCESIDLPTGQTEELSFVNASGETVVYLLQVVSIEKGEAAAHEARAHTAHEARAHGARAGARAHGAISYGAHAPSSDHRRRVARSRAHLHH